MKQERIPELDVFRGICVAGMLAAHLVFDLRYFLDLAVPLPLWMEWLGRYGHLLFIMLSGICATLGRNPARRGWELLAVGILISYVTLFADLILGWKELRIWFGILHLLGVSMLCYSLIREISSLSFSVLGLLMIGAGIRLQTVSVRVPWLFPVGLCSQEVFTGSDFFPILPNMGWFFLGAAAGKRLYFKKETVLPGIAWEKPFPVCLAWMGRHALQIYLIHQPVLVALVSLLSPQ